MMNRNKYTLMALIAVLLWGSLYTAVKLGYTAYGVSSVGDILYFAGVRFTICGAMITMFAFITRPETFQPAKKHFLPILLAGLFSIILNYGLQYTGLQLTESSKTALLKQAGSLLYVCFSFLFFRDDKLTIRKLVGVAVGFAGVVVINGDATGIRFGTGELLIIAASLCTVIANITSKKTFSKVAPVTVTGISQLFGGVVMVICGKLMGGDMTINADSSSLIMVYICIASIVSYCMWYTASNKSQLSGMFIIKFAEPVLAGVTGAMLLGENVFNLKYLMAFLLVASGIWISAKR